MLAHQVVGEDEIRLALEGILTSQTFSRSQQLSRLLKYLCDSLLAHGADRLAEYSIGVEALGRAADFDPTQDAAVRVEMHRLRRRLRDYYSGEGAGDVVRIEIPAGRYAPVVTRTVNPPGEEEAVENVESGLAPQARTFPGRAVLWISIAAAIAAVLITLTVLRRPAHAIAGQHRELLKPVAAIPPSSPLIGIRIGCGRRSPWTDRIGQIWGADEYFEGGESIEIAERPYIAGTFDARLFQSARTGTFAYRVPLPAQTYEMRLYFIEPVFGPENDQGGEANRLFRVAINQHTVLDRFDIVADADGPWTADVRVFKDVSPGPDGHVLINFETISSSALLNAIEFVPARPHILNPIRLLPQDNFYTDSAGNLWRPDNYSSGGRVAIHPGPVKNTSDPEIFRHERFGHFRYVAPVDRGMYSAYVYMSEEYWGPGNPGKGGEGTRVFSIFCNGVALLRGLDLYKESGINNGIVRAFHHLTPNAQGKLVLQFEPEHDYASIYGLEIIDEAGPDAPSSDRTLNPPGRS